MLWQTHDMLEAMIHLTKNYKTSKGAHQLLEKIIKRNCKKVMQIDYGLQILPDTVLHIANSEEFRWLLQPELKAIKDELKYTDRDGDSWDDSDYIYRGYINDQGQREGVGILTYLGKIQYVG